MIVKIYAICKCTGYIKPERHRAGNYKSSRKIQDTKFSTNNEL